MFSDFSGECCSLGASGFVAPSTAAVGGTFPTSRIKIINERMIK